jgi:hypothetical protein
MLSYEQIMEKDRIVPYNCAYRYAHHRMTSQVVVAVQVHDTTVGCIEGSSDVKQYCAPWKQKT